jgi:hypothetical protein
MRPVTRRFREQPPFNGGYGVALYFRRTMLINFHSRGSVGMSENQLRVLQRHVKVFEGRRGDVSL